MASTIKLKNGTGVPLVGDLVQGEPAFDLTNKRLYTENAGGTVIEVGTNPSTIVIPAGTINGTTIGAITPASVAATTLSTTGAATFGGAVDSGGAISINGDETVGNDGVSSYWKATSGTHYFQTGGATKMTLDSSGGLTTTGAATFNGNVAATRAVLGATDYATEQMSIFNSQAGAANNAATLGFHLSNLDWGSGATTARVSAVQENGITGATALVFGTATNGSETSAPERMRLDSSGNLGIGTSSPSKRLEVFDSTTSPSSYIQGIRLTGNAGYYYDIGRVAGTGELTVSGNQSGVPLMTWVQNATERMRIDASGNLAIGTTIAGGSASNRQITSVGSAASQLTLTGGGSFSTHVGTNGTVGYLEVTGANNLTLYTNSVERARLTSDGNLLVGTTSALSVAPKLAVESTNFVVGISGTNPTGELVRFYGNSRTVAGTISHLGSSVSYNTTSDQRLKENITDANDAGDKIDAIKVRQYDWKANGSHQDYGMVAQELMTVAPEAVYQPEDPKEMMGIDYSKLVPMLLKEIQSLRSRLDAAGL
jgi:hypothetical protein